LAVLQGDDESLAPRERALARLAVTLTSEPWAVTPDVVAEVTRQGFDQAQAEAAVAVIAVFNYLTRVADATGIEFDYHSPLPAFEPDLNQKTAARPGRPASAAPAAGAAGDAGNRPRPAHPPLLGAWESWRAYELEADQPLSPRERRLLASVAAEESTDWAVAEALGGVKPAQAGDDELIAFARKLSREPWCMQPDDLDKLRAAGHSEVAVLHVISVVAHQNADSRLAFGLGAIRA
jgi:alkylhydroperoxidase family enzyme